MTPGEKHPPTVTSLTTRTARRASSIGDFHNAFQSRSTTIARVHDLLSGRIRNGRQRNFPDDGPGPASLLPGPMCP